MSERPKLDFIYFDAGGGHRSAATALEAVITAEGYPWDVRLVNLQQVLDPLDIFRKITGVRLQDLYNRMLAKGLTLGAKYWLPMMQMIIRKHHGPSVRLLQKFWETRSPAMVVSLVPNLNRALCESLEKACPGTPFVGILTDLADYPPHFWMERQKQYFICGTPKALAQARTIGADSSRIFATSGMILRPDFYRNPKTERSEGLRELGLTPGIPTGLVLFGGEGSTVMLKVAKRLGNSDIELQLIFLCGRNQKLRERLTKIKTRNRIFVEGFTKEVPYYMHLADFFIGKPGPGSISEALHLGLPLIIEANAWTLPQERYNAQWVRENGYGLVVSDFRRVNSAVAELLRDGQLEIYKKRIAALKNRAVYEIPPILAKILANHSGDSGQECLG